MHLICQTESGKCLYSVQPVFGSENVFNLSSQLPEVNNVFNLSSQFLEMENVIDISSKFLISNFNMFFCLYFVFNLSIMYAKNSIYRDIYIKSPSFIIQEIIYFF